jgi:hypothetical protein
MQRRRIGRINFGFGRISFGQICSDSSDSNGLDSIGLDLIGLDLIGSEFIGRFASETASKQVQVSPDDWLQCFELPPLRSNPHTYSGTEHSAELSI